MDRSLWDYVEVAILYLLVGTVLLGNIFLLSSNVFGSP